MNTELSKRIVSDHTFPLLKETWERESSPTMVCLHHTASPPGVSGDINWWKFDKQPVSTPLIVGRDGVAVQIYPSTRWAFHLGLQHSLNRKVEAKTIGLELDSWGCLTRVEDRFFSWTKQEVPPAEVCILQTPHKGFRYFHKYTDQQIETTRLLLLHWHEVYGIPLGYVGDSKMFAITDDARYAKVPGIYSHNSFRADKTDIHPQPNMIEMLKGLAK